MTDLIVWESSRGQIWAEVFDASLVDRAISALRRWSRGGMLRFHVARRPTRGPFDRQAADARMRRWAKNVLETRGGRPLSKEELELAKRLEREQQQQGRIDAIREHSERRLRQLEGELEFASRQQAGLERYRMERERDEAAAAARMAAKMVRKPGPETSAAPPRPIEWTATASEYVMIYRLPRGAGYWSSDVVVTRWDRVTFSRQEIDQLHREISGQNAGAQFLAKITRCFPDCLAWINSSTIKANVGRVVRCIRIDATTEESATPYWLVRAHSGKLRGICNESGRTLAGKEIYVADIDLTPICMPGAAAVERSTIETS